jgi:hypothetical protein
VTRCAFGPMSAGYQMGRSCSRLLKLVSRYDEGPE